MDSYNLPQADPNRVAQAHAQAPYVSLREAREDLRCAGHRLTRVLRSTPEGSERHDDIMKSQLFIGHAVALVEQAISCQEDLLALADRWCSPDVWRGSRPFTYLTGEILRLDAPPRREDNEVIVLRRAGDSLRSVSQHAGVPMGARVYSLDGTVRGLAELASDLVAQAWLIVSVERTAA